MLAWRLARRELRGGLGGFTVFFACLTLGVAAIATVGVLNAGLTLGLKRDASALLGGDLKIDASNLPLTEAELAALTPPGARRSASVRTSAMAEAGGGRRVVVALKTVDPAYPLVWHGSARSADLEPRSGARGSGRRGRAQPARPARAQGRRPAPDRAGAVRDPRRARARAGPDRRLLQHRTARHDRPRSARAHADHPAGLARAPTATAWRCRRGSTPTPGWRRSGAPIRMPAGGRAAPATSSPRSPASPTGSRPI